MKKEYEKEIRKSTLFKKVISNEYAIEIDESKLVKLI